MSDWNDVLALVEAQLKARGISPAAASRIASGHPYLVYSLRKGVNPKYDTLKALCDALGLEFYIGPPRKGMVKELKEQLLTPEEQATISPELEQAIEEVFADRHEKMRREAAENLDKALRRVKEAVGVISRPPATPKAKKLEDDTALATLEVSPKVIEFPGGATGIAVQELDSAAGGGAEVLSERVKGYIYFRDEWLSKHRLTSDQCRVIGVKGESMEPVLPDGCSILVDHNRRHRRVGHIFVVRGEDGLVVKRAGKGEDGRWLLLSDNPLWKPLPWPGNAEIIGEVKWMARTL